MNTLTQTLTTVPENAPKLLEWLNAGRGIAFWYSADLGDISWNAQTPAFDKSGAPTAPPHWKADKNPTIITNASLISVKTYTEVKRIRIALKRGYGFQVVLTDASSRKLRAALDKIGKSATYVFDYDSQEAIIQIESGSVPLSEWKAA